MKLYNTMSRHIEEFKPLKPGRVSLYTCGLTVYSQPHIGNWVSYIYWDILVRTLRASGYKVTRVQNITDVGHLTSDEDAGEDKMVKGALREGLSAWQVAQKYIDIADREAYQRLGLVRPNEMPRATDFIPQQIAFIQELESKGYTYQITDGIYFDTSKLADYGKLARLDIKGLKYGARVEASAKKNPTDFAVWKFSPQDGPKRDMEWWAPWPQVGSSLDEKHPVSSTRTLHEDARQGEAEQRTESYNKYDEGVAEASTSHSASSNISTGGSAAGQDIAVHGSWGFPGWHLECSAMARELLGDTIDIHTGGIDHIPVHHSNEIAQSEAVTGKPFANYWLHANHIKVDGTKISKSLGNIYTLQDIVDRGYDLRAFKLMVLSKHYRTEGNFSWEILDAAQNRLQAWLQGAEMVWQYEKAEESGKPDFEYTDQILSALNNDLDTPAALIVVDQFFKQAREMSLSKPCVQNFLEDTESLLGISLRTDDISQAQKAMINDRLRARQASNWNESDRIREALKAEGINLVDRDDKTIWTRQPL